MHNFLILLSALNISSFCWSVFGVFKQVENRQNKWYYSLVFASLITYGVCLYSSAISVSADLLRTVVSSLLLLFSLGTFWYSAYENRQKKLSLAFSQDLPNHIVTSGPYAWVRHPFYFSYLTCYFTVSYYSLNPYAFVCFVMMFCIYYFASKFEEQKFMQSSLSQEYLQYRSRTPRFFPAILK